MNNYYDGTKLLSLLDINGKKPEIYICTSNRSAGKTTFFSRLLVNRFLSKGEKFGLIYRFNYELDSIADKFFKDINSLFFPNMEMKSERRANGIYHELYLDDKECGYAITLNSVDQIKKYSHLFSDISSLFFDEFQSETNHYCNNEVQKFIALHTTIARGQGKQYRYVPVFMVGNPVSIINPYYVEMGISNRLKNDTKFLRGNGFALEQGFVESASKLQKMSGFNQAFAKNEYVAYSTESIYLNDNTAFIETPKGNSRYFCTLRYQNANYGVREYDELGIIYCDDKADTTYPVKISVTVDDHNINYVMLQRGNIFIAHMKYLFEHGCFRFKNLKCKEAILTAISK